jgi:hypothetical protein
MLDCRSRPSLAGLSFSSVVIPIFSCVCGELERGLKLLMSFSWVVLELLLWSASLVLWSRARSRVVITNFSWVVAELLVWLSEVLISGAFNDTSSNAKPLRRRIESMFWLFSKSTSISETKTHKNQRRTTPFQEMSSRRDPVGAPRRPSSVSRRRRRDGAGSRCST